MKADLFCHANVGGLEVGDVRSRYELSLGAELVPDQVVGKHLRVLPGPDSYLLGVARDESPQPRGLVRTASTVAVADTRIELPLSRGFCASAARRVIRQGGVG